MALLDRSLAGIPLFRGLTPEQRRRTEAACTWRHASPGQWVIDEEGAGTDVFIVLRGHLRVITALAGRETILRDLRDGEFFGELAALDGQPRSAGILAVTTSVLACMPGPAFRQAIHSCPDVADQVLAVLVRQIRMLANRVTEGAGLRTRQRLWAELLRLSEIGQARSGSAVLSPPPTHVELAARVASHREAVTREMKALERGGLIERRRGAIEILDPRRLQRMVDEARAD